MTDAQYIEIGKSVVAMSHRGQITCDNGEYRLFVNTIPLTLDTAIAVMREMGWTVEKHDGSIFMSRDA